MNMKLHPIAMIAVLMFFMSTLNAQVAIPHFQKHTVKEGETATMVANKFHVSLTDFCLLNDFPETVKLKPGQVVLIKQLKDGEEEVIEEAPKKSNLMSSEKWVSPSESKAAPAKTSGASREESRPSSTSTAKESSKSEVSEPASEKPRASSTATIKTTDPGVTPPPSTKAVEVGPGGKVYNVSKSGYHVVEKGQTFYRIALIYGLSVDDLKALNGMSNTNIAVGQKLKVSK
jgi:LysM repeat protein